MKVDKKVVIKLTKEEKEFFIKMQDFMIGLWNDFSDQDSVAHTTDETEIFVRSIMTIEDAIENIFSCTEDEDSDE